MKKIKLANCDKYVIVDDEDYNRVNQYTWNLWKEDTVARKIHSISVPLRKFIYGRKTNKKIFHLNDNKFDFRKSNLSIFIQHVFIDGDFAKILLPSGKIAFTNKQYYDLIKDYTWYSTYKGYVICTTNNQNIRLHRLILNPRDGYQVDHINFNKLDNTIENLRECNNQQNSSHKSKSYGILKYKGINIRNSGWEVSIKKDQICYYLGCFKIQETAAQAYNIAAKELFKEFAWLNPVEEVESVVTTTGRVINKEYIQQLAQKVL